MSGDHNQYQKNLSYLDFECPRCGHCCYVDADDTSQKCVDEKAKREHEWVGLTDGEIDILSCETVKGNKSVNWLCKVLEAKLKEKNT